MPAQRTVLSVTGLSSTAGFPVYFNDWAKTQPQNTSVAAVLTNSTGSPVFNIECSLDAGSSAFISSNATWFSSFVSGATGNTLAAISAEVTAIRVNVTGGSSTQVLTATFVSA